MTKIIFNALHPSQVRVDAIDRQAEQFTVHALEQLETLSKTNEFGRANGSEVCGVRKQEEPLTLIIGQASEAVGGVGAEGRGGFVDEGHGHGVFPYGLTIYFRNRVNYSIDKVKFTYPIGYFV